ncbi:MAG: phage tail sheath protein, partial [Sarcina sp.]
AEGILDEGKNNVGIDIDAHKKYLNGKGINTDNYTIQQLKEANTGSNVLLKGNCRPLDAMEDLQIVFEMM